MARPLRLRSDFRKTGCGLSSKPKLQRKICSSEDEDTAQTVLLIYTSSHRA